MSRTDAPEREWLTVVELAERIERSERQTWRLLADGAFGEPEFRRRPDAVGTVQVQRVVPADAVDAYLAERGSGGGAGTGTGSGGSGTGPVGGSGTGPQKTE